MTHDSESGKIIMFGGSTANPMLKRGWNNETWSFDPQAHTWKEMSPEEAPGGFSGSMSYDTRADRAILVLNTDPETPNYFDYKSSQTWAYDLNTDTWTRLADGPSGRLGARVAYDSESDKMILFGGFALANGQLFNETWAYDFSTDTWTQMRPSLSPSGQNYHCMAYDSKADRIVSVGWETERYIWTYDYNTNTWQAIPMGDGPDIFDYCGFTYNDRGGLFILYGGSEGGSDETWTYDLASNTWQQRQPGQNPGVLSRHLLVYDPITDQSILFGGQIGNAMFFYTDKTWLYDLNTNTWTDIASNE